MKFPGLRVTVLIAFMSPHLQETQQLSQFISITLYKLIDPVCGLNEDIWLVEGLPNVKIAAKCALKVFEIDFLNVLLISTRGNEHLYVKLLILEGAHLEADGE